MERHHSFIGFAGIPFIRATVFEDITMKTIILRLFLTFAVLSGSVLAASRSMTLDVQNMTCAIGSITVKKALERVSGIQHVTVDYGSKTADMQFDDTVATADELTEAAGNSSTIKENGN